MLYLHPHRDKSFSTGFSGNMADASALEEKLEAVTDLKTQMRGLLNDNEEIKHTQEEVNTTLVNMNHHLSVMAEAIDRYVEGDNLNLDKNLF